MKTFLIIAVALIVVFLCVAYISHNRPPVPPAPVAVSVPAAKSVSKPIRAKRPLPAPVDISGPLKGRALVRWELPEYPEWAQEQGITGSVALKIWVTPAGLVKALIQPERMSGEPRLDEKAVAAIRHWQFAEKENSFGDQWGVVTIHYALLAKAEEEPGASVRGVSMGRSAVSGAWECVKKWIDQAHNEFVYICKLKPTPVTP